ncbi:MAG TPA: hypothetical protein VFQ88_00695 [Nevskiaceae bacterium]|nr:hypothetical protein [Nevskiaceae bacterium]
MSVFDIHLKLQPSAAFVGILAELNERFSDWTDGSYDWANQTVDFLHAQTALPKFDDSLYQTPLSKGALNDLLQVTLAMLSGNYLPIRDYLKPLHYAFVIGYPRSGGSYLTKELLRTVGLDHTHVSETLAHDGFPEMRQSWFDWAGNRPYYHLQESIFQIAEFLVISNYYYRTKTQPRPDGRWLVPKKMHMLVYWAESLKMLLGQDRADYLVTLRHPVPTAISCYEKSGGLPDDGLFPAVKPRSAIERWVLRDLMQLGYPVDEIQAMSYFDAVVVSWTDYYTRMATSGLFRGDRKEIRIIPYGQQALEGVVADYRAEQESPEAPEPFATHDKAKAHKDWVTKGNAAVKAVAGSWKALGLPFPVLTQT